ncbi:uncharacterized protein LOC111055870 isoform X1 [Nilaparvata lugens]|uniref:uncharacterized protein LOC111055870 isoform X1 n=1 Tax=Nilaparvata lugens TaxID=108931 RepID=UPI00193E2873|nr:uncharacterized protein LOC111055870 isoform X1 [Nilaparvata lugens]
MEPCYKEELRRCRPHLLAVSGVVAMWKCVVTVLCLTIVVRGAEVQQPSASVAKTLKVESDPWMSFIECFKSDAPGGCLQRRAFKALLSWAEGDEANEITSGGQRNTESDDEEPKVEGLPAGTPPAVGRIIDRLGDLIATSLAQFYPEPNDDGTPNLSAESEQRSNGVEQARGHKKKVKKEIKKAIIKVIIFTLLLKQKIKMLLMAAQTFLQFKFLMVAIVYVISNIIRLWVEIKQKHHPQKVIYYENAHHQHHYEPEHHDHGILEDHGGGWGGIWGRSIAVTPQEQGGGMPQSSTIATDYFPRSMDNSDQFHANRMAAQDLAYAQQKPDYAQH